MNAQFKRPVMVLLHGGTGRMGRTVVAVAPSTPDIVVAGLLDPRSPARESVEEMPVFDHIPGGGAVDVVVDFSRPAGVVGLVGALRGTGVRLVSGTTGLGAKERGLLETYSKETAVLYDENMSYGVSVVKRLLRVAASLLGDAADVEIVEYHHARKRDYPSGTAYGLARAVDPAAGVVAGRVSAGAGAGRVIHAHSVRLGGIVGEHHVYFATPDEVVTISHQALSREVFARGALRAVAFVADKGAGMYTMEDVAGV